MNQTDMERLWRLRKPKGRIDVVLDTDTYNEVDDQFALAYLIRSEEKLNLKAIYAAPFHNDKSEGPADGMEKSFREIHHILELMGEEKYADRVYKGSETWLTDERTPVFSPAAHHLAELAMKYSGQEPLYVVAIGAVTNVASALLLKPGIAERIVIVWLGGNAHEWPDNREFNCRQDVAAARVVFDSKAALVQLPCGGVVSAFTTCAGELEMFLRGRNPLCDYLVDLVEREGSRGSRYAAWTRVIWDVTAVGWLLEEDFMQDRLVPAPIPQYDHHYSFDPRRHLIRYVYRINRDALFEDLFEKLAGGGC
ncbi:MAG: nucleoside hydrolase [Muribaculaceae bacterium]|nr:nucleoside hydrolase [Muribaculaceae bacterium]